MKFYQVSLRDLTHTHTTYDTYFSFHRVTLDIKFFLNRLITPQVWFTYGETI